MRSADLAMLIAAGRHPVALKREIGPLSPHREGVSGPQESFAGATGLALSTMRGDLLAQLAPLDRYGLTALSAAVAEVLIAITRKRRH